MAPTRQEIESDTTPEAPPLRIGTRASLLARTQTGWVADQLRSHSQRVEIITISTQGDSQTDVPIAAIGGDGVFVRELEKALLENRIDAAVHSLKDMPTEGTPGLTVACVPVRAMPFDVLVAREPCTLESLPRAAVVGTSSVRRVAQVRAIRGDLVVRAIRGNVDTRLRRLDAGEYDCLILAGAGLQRLGLSDRITHVLRPDAFWPAVSQGALGVQIRVADNRLRRALAPIDDDTTHRAVLAERSCLAALAGGCLAPIGVWGHHNADGRLLLGGCVLEDSGHSVNRIVAMAMAADAEGDPQALSESPERLGRRLAEMLLAQGAEAMLARMRARAQQA